MDPCQDRSRICGVALQLGKHRILAHETVDFDRLLDASKAFNRAFLLALEQILQEKRKILGTAAPYAPSRKMKYQGKHTKIKHQLKQYL